MFYNHRVLNFLKISAGFILATDRKQALYFLFWCVFVIVSFHFVPYIHQIYIRGMKDVIPYVFLPHLDTVFFLEIAKHSLIKDIYDGSIYSYSPLAEKIHPSLDGILLQYYYSPLFAVLFYPLSLLSLPAAAFIWRLLTTLMLLRTVFLLTRMNGMRVGDVKAYVVIALCTVFLSHVLVSSLVGGETTLFLIWLTLEGVLLMKGNKHKSAAALLGLAVNIKFLSLPFLCYAAYRGYWRVLVWGVFFSLLYVSLPAFFYGFELNLQHHKAWSQVIGGHPLPANFIKEVVTALLTPFSASSSLIRSLSWFLTLFLICLTFYFLRRTPLFRPMESRTFLPEISYLFLVIPLIYPHQNEYSYFFTLPALVYVLSSFYDAYSAKAKVPLIISICLFIFTVAALIFGSPIFKAVYEYGFMFPDLSNSFIRVGLTVLFLFLIPLLAWCRSYNFSLAKTV